MTEPTKATRAKTENIAVGFCLDETGSMGRSVQATISGFNEFLADTRKQPGKTRLSLTKFSDRGFSQPSFRPVCEAADIGKVEELNTATYTPAGGTPLFDAIGYTIKKLESWLSAEKKKWAVLFVIQTDGQENASREYTRERIFELIRAKEAEGWRFIYLGVDQDDYAAETAATSMGMAPQASFAYNRGENVYATAAMSNVVMDFRESGGTASAASLTSTARQATAKRKTDPPTPPPPKRPKDKPNF